MRKILLIGHTGFIGRHIFEALKDKEIAVRVVSSKEINLLDTKSPKKLKRLLAKDTIIIIAAAITRELDDNLETMQKNIKLISNITQTLENTSPKKCVYLSTADVYGIPKKLPITEQTPVGPLTFYAVAKNTCEQILEITCKSLNIPFLVLRYNGVFGPGQKNIGYGPNYFIKSIFDSGIVKIWGDGKELRDTVYVRDLARIICGLSLGNAVGIYNIAAGKSQSFIDILNQLKKISTKKFKIEKRKRTSPAFNQTFDIKKLKKVILGFKFTPIQKSLDETYKAYLIYSSY